MNTLDKTNILNTDGSLNTYQTNIDSIKSILNKESNYNQTIEKTINDSSISKDEISSFLQGLSFVTNTNDDISEMDDAYFHFYNDLKDSNKLNSRLRKTITKYEATEAQLNNAKKTNTYYTFIIWMIIFVFVSCALFLSIIEDKKDMNIFSKTLLVLFLLIIFFYIAKNSWFYIERNIQ
jgi:hypothetical protein